MDDRSRATHAALDRFLKAINTRDFEAFAECLDPNVQFHMIGSTVLSGSADGRDAMLAVVGRVGEYTDENFIQLEELDRVVSGDRGVLRSRGRAYTKHGRPYENTYCHLVRVESGRFTEFVEYLDTDLIRRVLVAD
ncbi:MAG: nuclear transport factor 2 family protein [Proteobacteria bacterium]|nr:nuclear transport factor 2 family protein [Pseudomonadota bacterium]